MRSSGHGGGGGGSGPASCPRSRARYRSRVELNRHDERPSGGAHPALGHYANFVGTPLVEPTGRRASSQLSTDGQDQVHLHCCDITPQDDDDDGDDGGGVMIDDDDVVVPSSQDASLSYDPETPPGEIQSDVVFREGQTLGGHVTYTPRLIAMDLKGSLRTLRQEGSLYDGDRDTSAVTCEDPPSGGLRSGGVSASGLGAGGAGGQTSLLCGGVDYLQGFQVLCDMADGFAGLGSKVTEMLQDSYSGRGILTWGLAPVNHPNSTPVKDFYHLLNCTLATAN
ncbi:hypothetical protein INR49_009256, partial [Caranx melampygus]